MRADTLAGLGLWLTLSGCAGGQATIGSSVGQNEPADSEPSAASSASSAIPSPQAAANGGADGGATAAPSSKDQGPPEPPPPDPALVKALVEKTGESLPDDNSLHVRLEVTPRPAGELWLVAVVNRGTEPVQALFDLRRLSLSLETPEDPKKPRPKWKKKPAPTVCKLPEGFGGALAADEAPRPLEPGEGLVRTFDPRLYCISGAGDSLLKAGQMVTAKLGFLPKAPRVVYRLGKRMEVPSVQVEPFVVEPQTLPEKLDPENDPRVKQLASSQLELTDDLLGGEAEEDPTLPLKLSLLHGSDAGTERTATAVVEVRAKGKKSTVYFRRELVSYTVHGPDGIRACDPQPDDRAPDRQAYSSLGAGQAVSATSLLTELCPHLTFGRPGLYLLSARFDADRDGSEFGLQAFTGRLESRRQGLVRIRTGDLPALPPAEPLPVRVGQ